MKWKSKRTRRVKSTAKDHKNILRKTEELEEPKGPNKSKGQKLEIEMLDMNNEDQKKICRKLREPKRLLDLCLSSSMGSSCGVGEK